MFRHFHEWFEKVWTTLQNEHLSFYEAEQKELPIDHAKIGGHLAAKWQLPAGLVEAIRWHHEFRPESKNAHFVQNVYLANIIVNCYDYDQELRLDLAKIHPDVVKFIMDMMEDVGDWYSGLAVEIEEAYGFFLE